jgi:mannose PTS system EIIA component
MTVALILLTHGHIGDSLLESAHTILGEVPQPVAVMGVWPKDMDIENLCCRIHDLCTQIDQGEGVLILSDLIGATPSNSASKACAISAHSAVQMRNITGINLSMLLRVLTKIRFEPGITLNNLAQKALEGGHKGIADTDALADAGASD